MQCLSNGKVGRSPGPARPKNTCGHGHDGEQRRLVLVSHPRFVADSSLPSRLAVFSSNNYPHRHEDPRACIPSALQAQVKA